MPLCQFLHGFVNPDFMNGYGSSAICFMGSTAWQYTLPHIIRLVVEPNSWKLVDALLHIHLPAMFSWYKTEHLPHTPEQKLALETFSQILTQQKNIRYYTENKI